MKLLVTGATGQLGSLVVKHLLTKVPAEQIAVSVRNPQKAAHLKDAGVDVRRGDFTQPDTLTSFQRRMETACSSIKRQSKRQKQQM